MLVIDSDLKAFLESGLAIALATRSADLHPHAQRVWGAKVFPDGRSVEVFVDRPAATQTMANLRDNGRVATVFVDILTNRSVQLKGRCVEVGDPDPDDWRIIERHREEFTEATSALGFPARMISNLWSTQVVKVRFVVEDLFDQTPGPGAGRPL
ncbi:MAG TPA: pyridoxamine 5'-phosphate oxidase family protein [Dehalococcoidia bacterium]|nr:pyridoxamine 5'-phosphate oxidase family protein [Dehalococcoidia bacterium]